MLCLPCASTRVTPAPVVAGIVSAAKVVNNSIVESMVSADSTTAPIGQHRRQLLQPLRRVAKSRGVSHERSLRK
jgi:hypothetical protein